MQRWQTITWLEMETLSCLDPSSGKDTFALCSLYSNVDAWSQVSVLDTVSASCRTYTMWRVKTYIVSNNDASLKCIFVMEWRYCLQGVEGMECSSSSDARKELDCHHPSPVSILEATFSNESCNSSESGDVNNGGKLNSFSSIQAQNQNGDNCLQVTPSLEATEELSDCATSRFMAVADGEPHPNISVTDQMGAEKQEMEYVKAILLNARLTFQELALGHAHGIINPHLFDRLESRKLGLGSEGEDESSKISRKELFDCVSECMDSKCSRYICGGYKAWAKGAAILMKEGMAAEIYKEISGWRSRGEWMVDELVDKDMSSRLGRWLDFEAEAFETGMEIERRILRSLLEEVVTDFL